MDLNNDERCPPQPTWIADGLTLIGLFVRIVSPADRAEVVALARALADKPVTPPD